MHAHLAHADHQVSRRDQDRGLGHRLHQRRERHDRKPRERRIAGDVTADRVIAQERLPIEIERAPRDAAWRRCAPAVRPAPQRPASGSAAPSCCRPGARPVAGRRARPPRSCARPTGSAPSSESTPPSPAGRRPRALWRLPRRRPVLRGVLSWPCRRGLNGWRSTGDGGRTGAVRLCRRRGGGVAGASAGVPAAASPPPHQLDHLRRQPHFGRAGRQLDTAQHRPFAGAFGFSGPSRSRVVGRRWYSGARVMATPCAASWARRWCNCGQAAAGG